MEHQMAKADVSSTMLSRRSLVTSAAALPALAVPAVAVAAVAEPDPIFAAIEKYRKLDVRRRELADEMEEAELRLKELSDRSPSVALYPKLETKASVVEKTESRL